MISRSGKRILIMLLVTTFMISFAIMTESANAETRWTIPSDATEFNGHYYKVYEITYSWQEAKAYCKSLGGHLMTITSQEEQDLAKRLPIKSRTNYWIGGTDEKTEGNWKWVTGEKWSFTAWASNQPDNTQLDTGIDEDYLQLCTDWSARWNDSANVQDDTAGVGFICEWDSQPVSRPTNLKATQPALNQVKLTWKAGNNAKKYDIYRANGSNGTFTKIGTTKGLKYVDKTVKNGNTYRYKVKAINGNSSAYSSAVKAYPMDRPKSVKAKAEKNTYNVTVTWKKVKGAKQYHLYQKAPNSSKFTEIQTVTKLKATFTVTEGEGTYRYYVIPAVGSFMGLKSAKASVDVNIIKYRALVIGETYEGSAQVEPVDYRPEHRFDVQSTTNMLHSLTSTPYDVRPMINPTKSEITSEIDFVFKQADKNDVTLFYFAGHGKISNNSSNGALMSYDRKFITAKQLRRLLDNYNGKKIIILDCCHSGAMINNGNRAALQKHNSAFIQAFTLSNQSRANNLLGNEYYVITACTSKQASISFDRFSVFTHAFLDGCGWQEYDSVEHALFADTNNDSKVSFREAYIYSRNAVIDFSNDYNTIYAAEIAAGQYTEINMDVQAYPTNSSEVFWGR